MIYYTIYNIYIFTLSYIFAAFSINFYEKLFHFGCFPKTTTTSEAVVLEVHWMMASSRSSFLRGNPKWGTCRKWTRKHPWNLTWNLKIMVSKWTFLSRDLFSGSILNFGGCTSLKTENGCFGSMFPPIFQVFYSIQPLVWKGYFTTKIFSGFSR